MNYRNRITTLAGLIVGAAVAANAQSVYLRVQPLTSNTSTKQSGRPMDGIAEHSYQHSESLKITLTNMQAAPGDYVVKWQFLAKGVTDRKTRVYDSGTKAVSLKGREAAAFEVQSKPLEAAKTLNFGQDEEGNLAVTGQHKTGDKPAGYVILVEANEKLIAVESSDTDLKKTYQKEIAENRMKPKQ